MIQIHKRPKTAQPADRFSQTRLVSHFALVEKEFLPNLTVYALQRPISLEPHQGECAKG